MSDLRKAAEMALEALRNAEVVHMEQLNAMYALQEALAQPDLAKVGEVGVWGHKREWDGLDEVEVTGMTCECVDDGTFNMSCAHDFARAIEAKLKERNA